MARFLLCFLAIVLAAWSLPAPVGRAAEPGGNAAGAARGATFAVDDAGEAYLMAALNEERLAAGRAPLARDGRLNRLARAKAEEMAREGYFSHVSPNMGTVYDMLAAEAIAFKWAGENIARVPDVATAHAAFMESRDHRANILSAGYTHAGIGVVRAGSRVYVCQIFMKPSE